MLFPWYKSFTLWKRIVAIINTHVASRDTDLVGGVAINWWSAVSLMENCADEIGSLVWFKSELLPICDMQDTLHGLGPLFFCLERITTFGVLESNIGCPSLTGVLSASSKISCDTDCDVQPRAPSNLRYVATLLCRSSDETDCFSPSDSSLVYSLLASRLSNGCNSRWLELLRNVIIPLSLDLVTTGAHDQTRTIRLLDRLIYSVREFFLPFVPFPFSLFNPDPIWPFFFL